MLDGAAETTKLVDFNTQKHDKTRYRRTHNINNMYLRQNIYIKLLSYVLHPLTHTQQ